MLHLLWLRELKIADGISFRHECTARAFCRVLRRDRGKGGAHGLRGCRVKERTSGVNRAGGVGRIYVD
jgi:hypothetical protein